MAAELVARKVDVIAALGGTPPALAAKNATATIPIVFGAGDPVGVGLVASLARPGGNLTGISGLELELAPKLVELLSELVPSARIIALLVTSNNPVAEHIIIQNAQQAASAKGLELQILKASTESEINAAFVELQAGGLLSKPIHCSPAGESSWWSWHLAVQFRQSPLGGNSPMQVA